jgi:hypothetical protein
MVRRHFTYYLYSTLVLNFHNVSCLALNLNHGLWVMDVGHEDSVESQWQY